MLVVILVATSGGGDKNNGPEKVASGPGASGIKGDSGSSKNSDNGPGTESNPIKVGETVKLEGTQYAVRRVKKSPTVGGEFTNQKANGVYVVVTLTIENKK